jgi:hypothetical protein
MAGSPWVLGIKLWRQLSAGSLESRADSAPTNQATLGEVCLLLAFGYAIC